MCTLKLVLYLTDIDFILKKHKSDKFLIKKLKTLCNTEFRGLF